MSHKIDLSRYQIRTDLALEDSNLENIIETDYDGIKVSQVKLSKEEGTKIGKKEGLYITISFDDITDYDAGKKVKEVFVSELKNILNLLNIEDNSSCLIVGLGNIKSTPDSLGPKTLDNVLVTRHLFLLSSVEEGFREVSAFSPSVMASTGMEASDIIKGVISELHPNFIIVIDALASSSIERVNKTIQITNAGINPGSGIGNNRKEISFETLGVPVIAIGVPTVVDAATITFNTINYMYKHFSYVKKNINNPASKLATGTPNYLKKKINVDDNDKKKIFGLIGGLTDDEIYKLLDEVLTPTGYNLMVTPKEIDFIIDKLASIIGSGINMALHKNVNE